jgi:parallel beta-helix repeat protein
MSFQHNEVYGGLDGTRLIKSKEIIFSYNYIKQTDYNLLLLSEFHNGLVQNNVFYSDNDYGLRISLSSFNNISNNIFSSNALNLIVQDSSNNNSFYYNTFGSSPICSVWFEKSNDNVFSHNKITNEAGEGFELRYCSRCIITENDFLKGSVSFRYNILSYNFGNKWKNNYWLHPVLHPKIIKGRLTFGCPNYPKITLPWIQFDLHPAIVPNS